MYLRIELPDGAVELVKPVPFALEDDLHLLLDALTQINAGSHILATLQHPWGARCAERVLAMLPVVGGGSITLEQLLAPIANINKDVCHEWCLVLANLFTGPESLIAQLHALDRQRGQTERDPDAPAPLHPEDFEGRILANLVLLAGGEGALALRNTLSAGQIGALLKEHNALLDPEPRKRSRAARALERWQEENRVRLKEVQREFLGDYADLEGGP